MVITVTLEEWRAESGTLYTTTIDHVTDSDSILDEDGAVSAVAYIIACEDNMGGEAWWDNDDLLYGCVDYKVTLIDADGNVISEAWVGDIIDPMSP